ncbi:hypothetical protein GCM10010388_33730 [Streptomyces mauvecolor]
MLDGLGVPGRAVRKEPGGLKMLDPAGTNPARGAGNCATSHARPAAEGGSRERGELREQPPTARSQKRGLGARGTARGVADGPQTVDHAPGPAPPTSRPTHPRRV